MAYTKAPGIEDIFPDRIARWNRITDTARRHFALHNFREIIIPVLEYTDLFARGIGDETDIVSKEMFTFEDRGGRSLTLRPEGTASVVRAFNENGEFNRLSVCKLFYIGPMFRAERPQKGRLRQFNQFGAELFGEDNPFYDFEVIAMMNAIARDLGIAEYALLLNSIGCDECRPAYLAQLKSYYELHKAELCEDCKRRLDRNILRLLDCKNETCGKLKAGAPKISDHLCGGCSSHHNELKSLLNDANISYTEDPFLVRGLDYYCKTTFEFVATSLGGQNAFAAGGRYNKLVDLLGGNPTPAVGFAAGVERLMIITEKNEIQPQPVDLYVIYAAEEQKKEALLFATAMRAKGISTDIDPTGKSMKNQLKKMDRENARFAIIIGEEEAASGVYTLKDSAKREQIKVEKEMIYDIISQNRN